MQCYTSKYNKYLVYTVIAAVFYSAGIPLIFVYLVQRFKEIGKGGDRVVQGALGWMCTSWHTRKHACSFDSSNSFGSCTLFTDEPYRAGKEWWLGAECVL